MAESANLLRYETSPYLLQHADNPVHWRPWGPAALAEAKALDRPILLSIGYAACHWCHVMAHESFEDPETAGLMNRLFVNIKVDREERPDIDHLYMTALHALGQQGGWPLTMFLTPDGAPFWGGTYFPPEARWGRLSFKQVLHAVAEAYRSGHEMVGQNAKSLSGALASIHATRPGGLITPDRLDKAAGTLLSLRDPINGGLRGAPKFPNPPIFRFLWQNAFRTCLPQGREALHLLLQRMSQGGIYDHLGGGYARYSTDATWLVPHFEKMLYDNAQIIELLALAHADRPTPLYAERATETITWLDREMPAGRGPDGACAFAASQDADSEGEEGKFYVWKEIEIDDILGDDARAFKQAYDVTREGNWEGKTILHRVGERASPEEETRLARSRQKLFEARSRRIWPGRDDKVLADWNGLAMTALCRASAVFNRPEWLHRAEQAYAFVMQFMTSPEGRVSHAWRLGRVTAAGLLEDQAAVTGAALSLYQATAERSYLEQAIRLAGVARASFGDGHGAFYTTASDAADVPLGPSARPRHAADGPAPSGNGLMAQVYAQLFHVTGDGVWRSYAEALMKAWSGPGDNLANMPTLLAAADFLEEAAGVVIVGDAIRPLTRSLALTALSAADPAVVVSRLRNGEPVPQSHPAHGKTAGSADAAAYVCRQGTCSLPVTDPAALAAQLSGRKAPDPG
ncbi:MAG: thioredoxin domain-containing protein [Acetobacteraceae bacterium]|nr:thioredoxin domain-containing protein [Acetobacteraceae bacterium]